jgi:hypothetical protein
MTLLSSRLYLRGCEVCFEAAFANELRRLTINTLVKTVFMNSGHKITIRQQKIIQAHPRSFPLKPSVVRSHSRRPTLLAMTARVRGARVAITLSPGEVRVKLTIVCLLISFGVEADYTLVLPRQM